MPGARERIMSEAKTEGGMFLVIPSVVMLDEELPMSAKMLYGVIVWKCGQNACTWNSNRKLGEAIGLSPKRVSALLSLLEKNGYIETEIEYKDGTKTVSSRYIYPIMKSAKDMRKRDQAEDEQPDDDGTPPLENEDTPHPENGDTPLPGNEDTPPLKNEEGNNKYINNKLNKTPYSPPEGDAPPKKKRARRAKKEAKETPDYSPVRFAQFVEQYPGNVVLTRTVAAWDALKPDDALINTMARALKKQKASQRWRDGIGIPDAATWLKENWWLNKPQEPVSPPPDSGGWAPDPEVIP